MKKLLLSIMIILITIISVGAQSVTPDGAFTYSVPIEIPAGTNGMQPNISLNYNSNGGNGMLCVGWSLSGFPVISRDTDYPVAFDDSTDNN